MIIEEISYFRLHQQMEHSIIHMNISKIIKATNQYSQWI